MFRSATPSGGHNALLALKRQFGSSNLLSTISNNATGVIQLIWIIFVLSVRMQYL